MGGGRDTAARTAATVGEAFSISCLQSQKLTVQEQKEKINNTFSSLASQSETLGVDIQEKVLQFLARESAHECWLHRKG